MRKIYIFFTVLLFAIHGIAQTKSVQAGGEFFSWSGMSISLSAQGEYAAVGNAVWSYQTKGLTRFDRCDIYGVNDQGEAVGVFLHPELTYQDPYGSPADTLIVAGINKTGEWKSLGLGRFTLGTLNNRDIAAAYVISGDGKTIMGSVNNPAMRTIPFVWKEKADGLSWDTIAYTLPQPYTSGQIVSASADGSIAAGWVYQYGRSAAIWTSPTECKVFEGGGGASVSSNGKYVVAGNQLYNVVTKEFTTITTSKSGSVICTGVTDNGMVIGYRQIGMVEPRAGFIWSEINGFQDLGDFIKRYAPDINMPAYFDFNDLAKMSMTVPTGISADGTTIAGWVIALGSPNYSDAFVLRLSVPVEELHRPQSLKATVSNRDQVALTWDAPQVVAGQTFAGQYKVYRNGILIATVSETSYAETDIPVGFVKYTVSALYTGAKESVQADEVLVLIVDNYNIPFFENFDSGSFETNFWTVSGGNSRFNFIKDSFGKREGYTGTCVTYMNYGIEATEAEKSLMSKPLDASALSTVKASFFLRIPDAYPNDEGEFDSMFFEVCSNLEEDSWQIVDEIALDEPDWEKWTLKSYDISSYVAGKLFKFRFRGSDVNAIALVDIDNLLITNGGSDAEAPKKIMADVTQNAVNLTWQDPSGSYGLTYNKKAPNRQSIGNEGTAFIGANRFDPSDLKLYKGMLLTSISAYINSQNPEVEVETALSLAVYVDGVRVVNQEVEEAIIPNAWNTFKLNAPITISGDNRLDIGIEVREHDIAEYPLMTDDAEGVAGKGDLLTEDVEAVDNVIWDALAGNDLPYNWSIIGNVREAVSADAERTAGILGYDVYRDETKLTSTLSFPQTFQDDISGMPEAQYCYTVVAFYELNGFSEASERECISTVGIENNLSDNVYLYLDQATGELRVKGDFISASIFDLSGRKVNSSLSEINVASLTAGVYVVRIVCIDNSVITKKVILK